MYRKYSNVPMSKTQWAHFPPCIQLFLYSKGYAQRKHRRKSFWTKGNEGGGGAFKLIRKKSLKRCSLRTPNHFFAPISRCFFIRETNSLQSVLLVKTYKYGTPARIFFEVEFFSKLNFLAPLMLTT
jgi:hypothetical protein